jgi:regulator of protease activity HflC (stomatin/prohibitin superfamily)
MVGLWVLALIVVIAWQMLNIVNEYQRLVVFRLGRLVATRGPGLVILIPGLERGYRMDLRVITLDVPSQDVITRDNVSVKVNAIVFFRVLDPAQALVQVENYMIATSQLAQTTLRSVCGQADLDDLLSERDKINAQIQSILDADTDSWGIKVSKVEVKHIDLPQEMQRAMARQAEAERERRAKVIAAEGEFQASQRLSDAAQVIDKHPTALSLRYLQTLTEIAAEKNSTTIFPVPIDLFRPFLEKAKKETTES